MLKRKKKQKKDKHDSRHIPCLISMVQFLLSIKEVLKQSAFFSLAKSTVLESWQVHLFKQSSQVFCWQVFPEFLEHNSLDRILANIYSNKGRKVFSFAIVETPKCLRCKAGHSEQGLMWALGQGINNNKIHISLSTSLVGFTVRQGTLCSPAISAQCGPMSLIFSFFVNSPDP